jgi:hypothetical protein
LAKRLSVTEESLLPSSIPALPPEEAEVPDGLGESEALGSGSWGQSQSEFLNPKLRPHSSSQPPQYVLTQPQ